MTESLTLIHQAAAEHQAAIAAFVKEDGPALVALSRALADVFRRGGKLLVCGNGGSACDAMHVAGEFVGRFRDERRSLPAIALPADTSALTAIGNDYGYEHVFSRQIEGLGNRGDLLLALSTSGTSPNVRRALEVAKARGLVTALFTGEKGRGKTPADHLLVAPSLLTARVQEIHIFALHLLTELVEGLLAKDPA